MDINKDDISWNLLGELFVLFKPYYYSRYFFHDIIMLPTVHAYSLISELKLTPLRAPNDALLNTRRVEDNRNASELSMRGHTCI